MTTQLLAKKRSPRGPELPIENLVGACLIRYRKPGGVSECWVTEHFADLAGKTRVAERFSEEKYRSHPSTGAWLGQWLAASARLAPNGSMLRNADRVVAVPSSKGLSRRLAVALAESLQLDPPDATDLRWSVEKLSVKNLSLPDRHDHVRGAMVASDMCGEAIVLVDDALQSGATMAEASRAVRHAGASSVACIALLAIDKSWCLPEFTARL